MHSSSLLLSLVTLTMALTLLRGNEDFLHAAVQAMDPSKFEDKELEDDSSKQYKVPKKMQGF
jgi:hypothetical protein